MFSFTRRTALKLLCTPLFPKLLDASSYRKPTVIIAGAGLAGLCAGYELVRAGCNVTILEASNRSGGRVLTLREPFSDGLYAEAGAMYATNAQSHILKYCRQFSVPLIEHYTDRLPGFILHHTGQRVRVRLNEPLPPNLGLSEQESSLGIAGMWDRYILSPVLEMQNEAHPVESLRQKFDALTMAEFLKQQGATEAAVSLLRMGFLDSFGDGIDQAGAFQYLRWEALNLSSTKTFVIAGGSETLPQAFTRDIGQSVQLGKKVIEVEQNITGVVVALSDQDDSLSVIKGDFFISTLPLSILKGIKFTPALSSIKRSSTDQISYASVFRSYIECSERFWLKEN